MFLFLIERWLNNIIGQADSVADYKVIGGLCSIFLFISLFFRPNSIILYIFKINVCYFPDEAETIHIFIFSVCNCTYQG